MSEISNTRTINVRDLIIHKYIDPIRRPRTGIVGVEFELPIVNLRGEPVDFQIVHRMAEQFAGHFNFREAAVDDDGWMNLAVSDETGDSLSFDCSYNTLEFSFGTEESLVAVHERFLLYYSFIQEFLLAHQHTLTGMGINPHWRINRNEPIPNPRYRMLFHHLQSYTRYGNVMDFHNHPEFGLFSCASQIQLDTDERSVVDALHVFSALEPLKALIFANSPFEQFKCSRDYFWKHSLHGLNPRNVNGYGRVPESIDDIIDYIEGMSMYCLYRDGRYMNFRPTPLDTYFASDSIHAEYFDGEKYQDTEFRPLPADISDLRSFKFVDLTFRGTLELRSVCEQPVREIMAPGAFHTGIMHNLKKVSDILAADDYLYHQGYTSGELRDLFVLKKCPVEFDRAKISDLLLNILEAADEGLQARDLGESVYLKPLYRRAEGLISPADEMLDGLAHGKEINYYIHNFASVQ